VTASTPPTTEVGLIQLVTGSPALPPAGTRPDAMAPATAPMQYGTSTDESANAAPKLRWSRVLNTALRKAKLEPRSTMPSAARVSGTKSVSVIEAKASEKAVQSTTREKMSQTWFASHTGPIEWSMTARGRSPFFAPPAMRSQNPAPKSAPPKSAYAVMAKNSTMGTASASVTAHPPPQDRRWRGCTGAVGNVGVVHLGLVAVAATHAPQDEHGRHADREVERDDDEKGDPDPRVAGRGVLYPHVSVHDPRLSADFGDDPAGLQGDDREDAGDRRDPQEPLRLRDGATEQPRSPHHNARSESSVPAPTMTSQERCTAFASDGVGMSYMPCSVFGESRTLYVTYLKDPSVDDVLERTLPLNRELTNWAPRRKSPKLNGLSAHSGYATA